MPFEQTITIVNNSGKIIKTGKSLLSVLKEAKVSYQDKKAQVKSERLLHRAQTFGTTTSYRHHVDSNHHDADDRDHPRRWSMDDEPSHASSILTRPSKIARSGRLKDGSARRPRAQLTESNLQTLSEASSTRHPKAYHSPCAETVHQGMTVSRLNQARTEQRNTTSADPGQSMALPRRRASHELPRLLPRGSHFIDMDMAYGNIPPDLADRYDLDPAYLEQKNKMRARALVHRVEDLLDEAHCVQHSAKAIIVHLQENPDAAAAVALTLGELAAALSKMSPAFIGFLKGGSPAVFALLASPQFLIASGVAVGVTVVMFGGWKIVKKNKEARTTREALAFEGAGLLNQPAPSNTGSTFSAGVDEALVIKEELSTIETWRRGIASAGEDGNVDLELITPTADRATRGKDDDLKSRKSSTSHKTHRSKRDTKSRLEGKASRKANSKVNDGAQSELGRRKRNTPEVVEVRPTQQGGSKSEDDEKQLVLRPKSQRHGKNMLQALFRHKEKRKDGQLVLAKR